MSTIFGTCSIMTGHASMQARQVVQSQRTASVMTSPTSWSGGAASVPPPLARPAPPRVRAVLVGAPFAPARGPAGARRDLRQVDRARRGHVARRVRLVAARLAGPGRTAAAPAPFSNWFRRSRISSIGESALPVREAGQASSQRVHSVHASDVQPVLPGQVVQLREADRRRVLLERLLDVDERERALRLQRLEVDVGRGRRDVPQLRVRQVRDPGQRQHQVEPPEPEVQPAQRRLAERRQRQPDRVPDRRPERPTGRPSRRSWRPPSRSR